MRLLIALVVWAAAIAGAAELSSAVSHSIKTPTTPAGTSGSGPGGSGSGSGSSVDPSSVRATDSESLFRAANLSRALASARRALSPRAQVTNFALYPGYLVVTAAQGGQQVDLDLRADGQVIRTSSPGSGDTSSAFPLSAVDGGAPERLVARISRAAHLKPSALHYFVLMRDPTGPAGGARLQWFVYPQEGATRDEYFVAASAKGPLEAQTSSGRVPLR